MKHLPGIVVMVLLLAAAASAMPASPDEKVADGIIEISLERNCFGCPTGSVLRLRRDGTATYTVQGTSRSGTGDQVTEGRFPAKEFATLAHLVAAQAFFRLKEEYGDPQLRDGPWTAITVVCGGRTKKVISRDQAGPASLKKIVSAIEALRAHAKLGAPPTHH